MLRPHLYSTVSQAAILTAVYEKRMPELTSMPLYSQTDIIDDVIIIRSLPPDIIKVNHDERRT